ncbi:MAG TPA: hypothetical protein VJ418_13920, partial [Streptosporangiaceae bacterium]|nr:hypothetical protein [Streptosporangiaceae bacterium]
RVISGGSSSIPSQECIHQPAEGAYMPFNTNCDFMQRMRQSDMVSIQGLVVSCGFGSRFIELV